MINFLMRCWNVIVIVSKWLWIGLGYLARGFWILFMGLLTGLGIVGKALWEGLKQILADRQLTKFFGVLVLLVASVFLVSMFVDEPDRERRIKIGLIGFTILFCWAAFIVGLVKKPNRKKKRRTP